MNEATAPQKNLFNIEKLYVKDLSLEVPHAPGVFLERENPRIDLKLRDEAVSIEDGVFEVVVTITVTARLEDKVMFLIEAEQAGIFRIENFPQKELGQILGGLCPGILYPYLNELVSSMSVRAGFAPVLLNPINFDALYQQKQLQADSEPVTTH